MTPSPGSSGASAGPRTSSETQQPLAPGAGVCRSGGGEACALTDQSSRGSSSASLPPLVGFSSDTTIWPSAGVRRNSVRLIDRGTLALVPRGSVANAPVLIELL